MNWSAWKGCNSQGVIDASLLPCEYMQMRWMVAWEVDLNQPLLSTQYLKGKWTWRIRGPSDEVYLDQDIEVQFFLVSIGVPGLQLYTGYLVDSLTKIETRVPVTPVILGNPQGLGEEASLEGDMTNRTVYIAFWWQAPYYQLQLPEGCRVEVPFRNVGYAWLVKLAQVQFRTGSVGGVATYADAVGIHRVVEPVGGLLSQLYSRNSAHTYELRRVGPQLTSPQVNKLPDNTLLVLGKLGQADWRLAWSQNDGLTWEGEMPIWTAEYTDVKLQVARDGTILSLARHGGQLWVKTSLDNYTSARKIGPANRPFELALERATGRLIATDGISVMYISEDSGLTWQRREGVPA